MVMVLKQQLEAAHVNIDNVDINWFHNDDDDLGTKDHHHHYEINEYQSEEYWEEFRGTASGMDIIIRYDDGDDDDDT